jgi:tetratricopeptide (TPR) repeat protein
MRTESGLPKIVIAAVLTMAMGSGLFVLGAQAQEASVWKDRAEYDAYTAIEQATDQNQKVQLADKYLAAYPESKVAERVYALKLQSYQQLNNSQGIEQTAAKLLEINPKNFQALYLLSFLIPRTINVQDASSAQKLDSLAGFAQRGLTELGTLQMPQGMAPAQFEQQKNQSAAVFHQSAGFVALQKKDYAKAAESLRRSAELNPNDGLTFYWLGSARLSPKPPEYDPGIWAMARAISITGQNALPGPVQQQVRDYLTKVYEARHGSTNGLDDVLAQASRAPFPPAGFHVLTLEETPEYKAEQEALRAEEARLEALRVEQERKQKVLEELTTFDIIVKNLQGGGQKGDDTWEILHGQVLPLSGRVVELTAVGSRTVLLAVSPAIAAAGGAHDLELTLAAPLAEPLRKSQDIQFEGKIDSFTPRPFMMKMVQGKVK